FPPMQAANSISNILHALQTNQLSVAGFVQGLLNSKDPHHHIGRESLLRNAGNICSLLYHQESAHEPVSKWAIAAVTKIICREVTDLSHERHGLYFKASAATVEQLEGKFMEMMATKIHQDRRRAMINLDGMASSLGSEAEMDLGEFGGHETEGWKSATSMQKTPKKNQVWAAERNAALMAIVSLVVCISIFLQNSNERCNYLQGILGFFYHSTSVPEKVIETLAHAGLSISISSIHSAVQSVSNQTSARIRHAVRSLQSAFAYDNFDIDFKTDQPTLKHRSNFVSATSATVIPLFGVNSANQLRCSQWMWE
ncbi:uncharacterized protein EDB93DRAFT_1097120, partial [Suillus bovinus]|uniref:uncharacterized protein n=1 Tax=Suillus bovinus TaxID=48563 RepID=UPI001B86E263